MENTQHAHRDTDIVGLILLLWNYRKRIVINCFIGGVLSIIVAYSIPKQYTSTVILAPETSSSVGLSGGLSSLASMAGFDLGSLANNDDALYPELYPQIVSSTPFLCELLALEVESKDGELKTFVYDYLANHQKKTWWGLMISTPIEWLNNLFGNVSDSIVIPQSTNSMDLTKAQLKAIKGISDLITVEVDPGNSIITLGATMQDPKIAAVVVETVSKNLQTYIGKYRSAKARKDLAYTEMLYEDAQAKYHAAQQEYAAYADRHMGIVKMQAQIELDRLSNEQELAFNVYNQVAQQLEITRAKVEESTPICVEMQPAVVPYKASSPKKMMIGLLYVFLAFFGTVAWIVVKNRIINAREE